MQKMTWSMARFFSRHDSAVLQSQGGGKLEINLNDGYWTKLLVGNFVYESEIGFVLSRLLRQPDTYFLDCGANIGYWSVFAGRFLPPHHSVAIEASPAQFDQLLRNAHLNEDRFEPVLGAVWSVCDDILTIVTHDLRHAGSSVVNRRNKLGEHGYQEHSIKSVTIDSVCDQYIAMRDARVVIKLDVEDAEIQALEGASRVLGSGEVAVLYEDHGQDRSCRISKHFFDHLNFDIFYCDESNKVTLMGSLADVIVVKKSPSKGYNFSACSRGSLFSKIMMNCCGVGSSSRELTPSVLASSSA